MKKKIIKAKQSAIISELRKNAAVNMVKQAEKMKAASEKRFPPANIGDTVMVPIPDVDRGRAEFTNVKAVVIEVINFIFFLSSKIIFKGQWRRNLQIGD